MTNNQALAIVHIGMLLAEYSELETLPESIVQVNDKISEIFGIEMMNETDIETARNKIVAVIDSKGKIMQ